MCREFGKCQLRFAFGCNQERGVGITARLPFDVV